MSELGNSKRKFKDYKTDLLLFRPMRSNTPKNNDFVRTLEWINGPYYARLVTLNTSVNTKFQIRIYKKTKVATELEGRKVYFCDIGGIIDAQGIACFDKQVVLDEIAKSKLKYITFCFSPEATSELEGVDTKWEPVTPI